MCQYARGSGDETGGGGTMLRGRSSGYFGRGGEGHLKHYVETPMLHQGLVLRLCLVMVAEEVVVVKFPFGLAACY